MKTVGPALAGIAVIVLAWALVTMSKPQEKKQ